MLNCMAQHIDRNSRARRRAMDRPVYRHGVYSRMRLRPRVTRSSRDTLQSRREREKEREKRC